MPASPTTSERGIPAPSLVFQNELFDERCREQGAETEEARATLCGVDRATLYRYRTGRTVPLLPEGMRFANCVGLTVAELWRELRALAS
jgi:hypothetical protein